LPRASVACDLLAMLLIWAVIALFSGADAIDWSEGATRSAGYRYGNGCGHCHCSTALGWHWRGVIGAPS
jgi:hypothetical protein